MIPNQNSFQLRRGEICAANFIPLQMVVMLMILSFSTFDSIEAKWDKKVWQLNHSSWLYFILFTLKETSVKRKNFQSLTLVGPTWKNPVVDSLAALHLDNRLLMIKVYISKTNCIENDLVLIFHLPM